MAKSPAASLVMGHKKVERLADVQGLKLRASGGRRLIDRHRHGRGARADRRLGTL
jgi:hypothetical protein